jgi:FAD/FMN-containing dehydrogenase
MTGLMLGGGYGPLMTRFGLACDNLLSAEVVLPNGAVRNCDDKQDTDLFWALRGGGGNFGVVSSARLRLHAPGNVLAGNIIFPWANVREALAKFTELMFHAPAELFGAAVLSEGPGGMPVVVILLVWTGEIEAGKTIAAELAAIGKPVVVKIEPMQASKILSLTDGKLAQGRGYEVATRWFRTLKPETIRALITAFEARTSSTSSIIIHHCHGAATQVAPNATAFGMREPHFTALIYATWEPMADDGTAQKDWAHRLNSTLARTALPGGYANLLPDTAADQIAHAYGPNASRLAALKAQFDPATVLRAIPLPPAADEHPQTETGTAPRSPLK